MTGTMVKRFRNAVLGVFKVAAIQCGVLPSNTLGRHNEAKNTKHFTSSWVHSMGIEITLPRRTIVVHADSRGGSAFLVRYWFYLERNSIVNYPGITLFYIYLSPSRGKSQIWQEHWEFIRERAKYAVGDRFEAFFAMCEPLPHLDCHADIPASATEQCRAQLEAQGILDKFRHLLDEPDPVMGNLTFSPVITGTGHPSN